jgi:hypothetical protein
MRALVFSATGRGRLSRAAQGSRCPRAWGRRSSNASSAGAPVQLVDDWTIARGSTGGSGTVLFEDRSQSHDASEIISYQPALARDGVIVWYAGFADHVSLLPSGAVLAPLKGELTVLKTSRGTVQFPLDTPLPIARSSSGSSTRGLPSTKRRRGGESHFGTTGSVWLRQSLAAWRMICRQIYAEPYDLIPKLWRYGRISLHSLAMNGSVG